MNLFNLFISTIVLACISRSQALYSVGKCPPIPVIPDFRLNNYQGVWYDIQKLPVVYQIGLKCVTATYEPMLDDNNAVVPNSVKVINQGTRSLLGENIEKVTGQAYIPNISAPNKLNLQLNVDFLGINIPTGEGNYNVMYSDYTSYSIVYTCSESNWYFFTVKSESAWILSRTKVLEENKLREARNKISQIGVNVEKMSMTDQSCP